MRKTFGSLLTFSFLFYNASALAQKTNSANQNKNTIRIAAVGDIMIGSGQLSNSIEKIFGQTADIMSNADIRFGNLEGPIFEGSKQHDGKSGGTNRFAFKTPIERAEALKIAGFNVLSLANNHAKDFGQAGLEQTKETLKMLGIQYSDKSGSAARFNIQGKKIALIATDFYPGNRSITTPEKTLAEIEKLSQEDYLVIVSAHSGAEGQGAERVRSGPEFFMGENRGDVIRFSQQAIDAGADLILMHGPHVPRGFEIYKERLIAYSLGNFLTEKGISINGYAGLAPLLIVDIDIDGRFVHGKIHSFQQSRNQGVVLDPSSQALRLMYSLSKNDFPNTSPEFDNKGRIFSDLSKNSLRLK